MSQKKQEEASAVLKTELNDRFADLKDMIADLRPGVFDPQKQPEVQSPSASAIFTANHHTITPPDPPDYLRFGQGSSGVALIEQDKAPNQAKGLLTRLSKVGFPYFDGSDLRDWIFKCEQFFPLDGTPDDLKVRLATIHMTEKALQWHHNYIAERFGVYPPWTEYVVAISHRFGGIYNDPLSELVSLKQAGDSVEVFLDKFECALTRLSLPHAHSLSIFLTNLNPHLSLHTRQFSVTTVAAAASIARMHETYMLHSLSRHSRAPFSPPPKPNSYTHYKNPNTNSSLLHLPESTKQNHLKLDFIPKITTERPTRKFSFQEMQDRKAKGLCMYCDEAFTPDHQAKHRRSQIFVIECANEDDLSDDDELVNTINAVEVVQEPEERAPVISLNALNGCTTFNLCVS